MGNGVCYVSQSKCRVEMKTFHAQEYVIVKDLYSTYSFTGENTKLQKTE